MMNEKRRLTGRRQFFSVLLSLLMTIAVAVAELPDTSGGKHMGVATCAASQCHGSAVPRSGSNVLQNEYVTWTQYDPHAGAYEALSSDLSGAIAQRLGLSSARTADLCLDCHTDNVPVDRRGDRFQISDGVGCEACHGGAENWLSTHDNAPVVTHSDNIAAGMFSTDVAADRAELCLSCHLGTQDKFASHRIMAAGHPRLAFELDTFTEIWRTAGRQPHYRTDADYRERKAGTSHSDAWAAGLLVEGRLRLTLIREQRFAGRGLFPELGLYDCHACHRSMKTVQWRALPRHGNAGPGAPFLNDGTFVMALALANTVATDEVDALQSSLRELHVAGSSSVGAIGRAAQRLDAVLERIQSQLSAAGLRSREPQLLAEILRLGAQGNFLDYVSAEQAFMAVQMLAIELDDADLEAELDELAKTLENDERYQPAQFAKLLRRFDLDQ